MYVHRSGLVELGGGGKIPELFTSLCNCFQHLERGELFYV